MRALVVLVAIAFLMPLTFAYPQVGLFVWGWLTFMQPHREAYAGDLRLNLTVAIVTILAWLLSKERKTPPPDATSSLIILFMAWMVVCQIMSLRPEYSWPFFDRFIRVMTFILLCAIVLNSKARIHAMVWILCISIVYYGVKGGAFTLASGGGYHALGPPNTMISDNNAFGAALVILIPLLNYLRLQAEMQFVRVGLTVAMVLTLFSILGSQSRGALIALASIAVPFWWRSQYRLLFLVGAIPIVVAALLFMPESWYERMETIRQFDQDASFQGRVDAWVIAIKIALGNPLTGAGFRVPYLQEIADIYLLEFREARAAHSIYFEILGSMGFVGLGLFLGLLAIAFSNAVGISKCAASVPELAWTRDFAHMAQTSLIAFCVGGSALSIEFWEGPWLIMVILSRIKWEMVHLTILPAAIPSTSRQKVI